MSYTRILLTLLVLYDNVKFCANNSNGRFMGNVNLLIRANGGKWFFDALTECLHVM